MKKEFAPVNVRPETLSLLKKIKKETGVAYYRIIADGVALYAAMHKKRKPVRFEFGGESK